MASVESEGAAILALSPAARSMKATWSSKVEGGSASKPVQQSRTIIFS